MSDPELKRSDWLSGGFPEPKSVTKNQRMFINRRAHRLKEVLSKEQQVALRMMRFEFWLTNLSRFDASAIINKIRILEDQEKETSIAKKSLKKRSAKADFFGDACCVCGGELEEDLVSLTCKICGKGAIRVSM